MSANQGIAGHAQDHPPIITCNPGERPIESHIQEPNAAGGVKHDKGKPRMTLVPGFRALEPVARVMEWAVRVKGYPPLNWQTVEPERYREALARHFFAWLENPRGVDAESGHSHLAHLACCVLILLWHRDDTG